MLRIYYDALQTCSTESGSNFLYGKGINYNKDRSLVIKTVFHAALTEIEIIFRFRLMCLILLETLRSPLLI